jgi:hypothetical protein
MERDSINQKKDESLWRTRDVLWLVFSGVIVGVILTFVILQVKGTSTGESCQVQIGGRSNNIDVDIIKKLNDDTLSMLRAAFR